MDLAERAATGKEARTRVPRSDHADWAPPAERGDPVQVLEEQATSRVPELLPIRYGRMAVSPFTFYRGAAAVMAADLAATPTSGLEVQMCGDAHLSNFGVFAAPDRRLVFDLNDFDETLPGPWEWDVKRLAASFEIAARDNGFKRKERRSAVETVVRSYRESMREFAKMRNLEIWYARLDAEEALESLQTERRKGVKKVEKAAAKARAKDSVRALDRLTERVEGELQIASRPPLLVPIDELVGDFAGDFDPEEAIQTVLKEYTDSMKGDRQHLLSEYRYRDLAHKVVGVGSVGTRAWIVLMTGRDDSDPLFLQAKEAGASVYEPYVGKSRFRNHGRRVVEGQWLMQAASDSFLGWCAGVEADGRARDYYVRQLWDEKGSGDIESMRPRSLEIYAKGCGWTLARAHARSGDAVAIGAYLGSNTAFDDAIAEFSDAYADQNERDHAELLAAIDSGRLEAVDA
ncbi:DUF2252 domain-containing protein [Intrasporangium sp.]|uniref:DUF2252 domain-containing protein n=1 Tax=Intrasporangium sp. TaxID=1925024 RepID=UPI003365792D